MKAIICPKYGPPDLLRLVDLPMPVPRGREIRVRVLATGAEAEQVMVAGFAGGMVCSGGGCSALIERLAHVARVWP